MSLLGNSLHHHFGFDVTVLRAVVEAVEVRGAEGLSSLDWRQPSRHQGSEP